MYWPSWAGATAAKATAVRRSSSVSVCPTAAAAAAAAATSGVAVERRRRWDLWTSRPACRQTDTRRRHATARPGRRSAPPRRHALAQLGDRPSNRFARRRSRRRSALAGRPNWRRRCVLHCHASPAMYADRRQRARPLRPNNVQQQIRRTALRRRLWRQRGQRSNCRSLR